MEHPEVKGKDNPEIEDLIKECAEARLLKSQKLLAVAEHKLWLAIKKRESNLPCRRDWFFKTFGRLTLEYEARSSIYNLGEPYCDELFQLVDKQEVPISNAAKIAGYTRKLIRKDKIDVDSAFKSIMDKTNNGKKRLTLGKNHQPKVNPTEIKTPKASPIEARNFREQMRFFAKEYVNNTLGKMDIDLLEQRRIVGEFNEGLDHLIDDLCRTSYRAKQEARNSALAIIGETQFTSACETLNIYDAVYKEPIDMKRVSNHAKKRSFELHPDRNKDERAVAEYQAVQEARQVLEWYSRQVGAKNETK